MESPVSEITPMDLHQRMVADPKIVIIDILPPDHFERVHLPCARNACVFEVAFL